nr:hypothetical protein [Tanacetum cinerariifolium]
MEEKTTDSMKHSKVQTLMFRSCFRIEDIEDITIKINGDGYIRINSYKSFSEGSTLYDILVMKTSNATDPPARSHACSDSICTGQDSHCRKYVHVPPLILQVPGELSVDIFTSASMNVGFSLGPSELHSSNFFDKGQGWNYARARMMNYKFYTHKSPGSVELDREVARLPNGNAFRDAD